MKNLIFIILGFSLLPCLIHSQNNRMAVEDDIILEDEGHYGPAVYIELAGRGYLSLNYEFPVLDKSRLSFGLAWNDMEVNIPDEMHESFPFLLATCMYSRLFSNEPSFFELGVGGTYAFLDLQHLEIPGDLYENEDALGIGAFIGYRYQSPKGFLFRVGFMPSLSIPSSDFWPLGGLSFGYSW